MSYVSYTECTNDEMRLVDGRTGQEGRVEVCQEGLWGSVCDNGWLTQTSGLVVCRQLGINATGINIACMVLKSNAIISYYHLHALGNSNYH